MTIGCPPPERRPVITSSGPYADTPRVYRRHDGRLVGGVAGGLADHLGLSPLAVRLGFVALAAFNGLGALLYAVYWAVLPQAPDDVLPQGSASLPAAPPDVPARGRSRRRRPAVPGELVAFAALAVGLFIAVQRLGLGNRSGLVLPTAVVVVGGALIWRQADEAQRTRWQRLVGGPGAGRKAVAVRLLVGGALVVIGLTGALATTGNLAAVRDGLFATGVLLVGFAVVTGPWWWRTWNDLGAERRERIRSQERAELAAHVHDSVLHTLALIQRHVDDPREVIRLARGQERELRAWLYRPTGSPDERFAAALEAVSAEVEDTFAVSVETVVVGDCPVDEPLAAMVQATREALVNAAKHAGVAEMSLYAEVEPDEVTVFVRDRGKGFDPDTVAGDRHGVSGSIIGRMQRHGGTAQVRSAPGQGTEVRLRMDRTTPAEAAQ